MRLALGRGAEVAAWVGERIACMPRGEGFGPCSAIGVENAEGRLIGGVVYHDYRPAYGSIELSFAGEGRWLTRRLISGLLGYPFDQLQVQRVTGVTPSRAASALRFLQSFGFVREGVVRGGFGDDDAIISGLLASEWRASRFNVRALNDGQAEPAGADGS